MRAPERIVQLIEQLSHEDCDVLRTSAVVGEVELAYQLLRLDVAASEERALMMATPLRVAIMEDLGQRGD